jgi:hypothetical protein
LKSLKQILEEVKKNSFFGVLTDEEIIYFAAYNLFLDIKKLNNETMTWKEFFGGHGLC